MKLKTTLLGIFVAVALVGGGLASAKENGRHPTPKLPPNNPVLPGLPGNPLPGWPTDPNFPEFPKLPPPGGNPVGEPGVPFPMNITLPFPWGNIEGLWKVAIDKVDVVFSFKLQTDHDGHEYLEVLQINSANGTILAEGVGISIESDKLVRAAMKSIGTNSNYMLFIGSYKITQGAQATGRTAQSKPAVTVLTVRPFTDLMGSNDIQVIVSKISNAPFQKKQCQ